MHAESPSPASTPHHEHIFLASLREEARARKVMFLVSCDPILGLLTLHLHSSRSLNDEIGLCVYVCCSSEAEEVERPIGARVKVSPPPTRGVNYEMTYLRLALPPPTFFPSPEGR